VYIHDSKHAQYLRSDGEDIDIAQLRPAVMMIGEVGQ